MALTAAERKARQRQKEAEERAAKRAKLDHRNQLRVQREREGQHQKQDIMNDPNSNNPNDERPGVETPFVLHSNVGGEVQVELNPTQLALLERQVIRRGQSATETRNQILSSSKVSSTLDLDTVDSNSIRATMGTPSRAALSTAKRTPNNVDSTTKKTRTPNKVGTTKSTAKKRKAPPRSYAKPPIVVRRRLPNPFPVIEPKIAMLSLAWYKDPTKILDIGLGAGEWTFDLRKHLMAILDCNPKSQAVMVGYRHEERPVIQSIHKSVQIHVPFFTVHVLPANAPLPSRLAVTDLEKKTCDYHCVADLPLKYEKVAESKDGQKVHMLVATTTATTRPSARSFTLHAATCTGGQLWYPIPLDSKQNPAEAFSIDIDDETFYFVDEMNDIARSAVRRQLADSGDTWADFCHWGLKAWMLLYLPAVVDAFFAYEDDLSRELHEKDVTAQLSTALRAFKIDYDTEQGIYEEHEWYAAAVKHFKIYPENECLHGYLSKGCSQMSKWCGRAEAVFPDVPVPDVVADAKATDILGVPRDA